MAPDELDRVCEYGFTEREIREAFRRPGGFTHSTSRHGVVQLLRAERAEEFVREAITGIENLPIQSAENYLVQDWMPRARELLEESA